MANFVLIDSNIAGLGGHYLEYADQILEEAKKSGFSCHLIANRAFDTAGRNFFYTPHPVFDYDMWGNNIALRTDRFNIFSEEDKRYVKFYYSRAGLIWQATKDIDAVRQYSQATTLPARAAKRLRAAHRLRHTVDQLLPQLQRDMTPPTTHAEARKKKYARLRDAARMGSDGALLTTGPSDLALAAMESASAAADGYAQRILDVLKKIETSSEDVIFIPTLSLAEARAVRDLLRRSSIARKPSWVMLFRRDVYTGYSDSWPQQEWIAHEARNLFASFLDLPSDCRVGFLTDTDMLTRQYERLGSVPFHTTAVPVRTPQSDAVPKDTVDRRLKVVLLRDTQSDHGISYLSSILEMLDPAELARLHFVVPTRSLECDTGGGSLWHRTSVARLRPYLHDVVTIVDKDVPADQIFSQADVVIAIEPRNAPRSHQAKFIGSFTQAHIIALENSSFIHAARAASCEKLTPYDEGMTAVESGVAVLQALREAVRCADLRRQQSPAWTIGFLGDARAEKGFHQLPVLISKLVGRTVAGRSIKVASQVFHPDPASDIRMLKAMEKIGQLPEEYRDIEPGALSSDQYLNLISRVDIVHNVYNQHNYISRSSGVFVEALAARKPLITTAGTWMSALMGSWSKPFHDSMLASTTVIDQYDYGPESSWKTLTGAPDVIPPANTAELAPGVTRFLIADVAEQANHVRIEVDMEMASPEVPICVTIAWRNTTQAAVHERSYFLNTLNGETVSLVLPVHPHAHDAWIGLSVGANASPCTIRNVGLSWLDSATGLASLPGGMVVNGHDDNAEQLKDAAINICENYESFQASCDWIWDKWTKYQNVTTLMADIMALRDRHVAAGDRFQGGDW